MDDSVLAWCGGGKIHANISFLLVVNVTLRACVPSVQYCPSAVMPNSHTHLHSFPIFIAMYAGRVRAAHAQILHRDRDGQASID